MARSDEFLLKPTREETISLQQMQDKSFGTQGVRAPRNKGWRRTPRSRESKVAVVMAPQPKGLLYNCHLGARNIDPLLS